MGNHRGVLSPNADLQPPNGADLPTRTLPCQGRTALDPQPPSVPIDTGNCTHINSNYASTARLIYYFFPLQKVPSALGFLLRPIERADPKGTANTQITNARTHGRTHALPRL
jgi:hypothetical protein